MSASHRRRAKRLADRIDELAAAGCVLGGPTITTPDGTALAPVYRALFLLDQPEDYIVIGRVAMLAPVEPGTAA